MPTLASHTEKADHYREYLRHIVRWDPFLLAESKLPGPRANLELAQAVADLGTPALIRRYVALTTEQASMNSSREFLVANSRRHKPAAERTR